MMVETVVGPGTPQMTIRRMCIAFRIPKAIKTQPEYEKVLLFHCNNGCKNAPQYYVIKTRPEYEKVLLFHCNNGCKNAPQYYVITHVGHLV